MITMAPETAIISSMLTRFHKIKTKNNFFTKNSKHLLQITSLNVRHSHKWTDDLEPENEILKRTHWRIYWRLSKTFQTHTWMTQVRKAHDKNCAYVLYVIHESVIIIICMVYKGSRIHI